MPAPYSSGFVVTPSELQRIAAVLSLVGGNTIEAIGKFDQEARAILGESWLGIAGDTFASSYRPLAVKMMQHAMVLYLAVGQLVDISKEYERADKISVTFTGGDGLLGQDELEIRLVKGNAFAENATVDLEHKTVVQGTASSFFPPFALPYLGNSQILYGSVNVEEEAAIQARPDDTGLFGPHTADAETQTDFLLAAKYMGGNSYTGEHFHPFGIKVSKTTTNRFGGTEMNPFDLPAPN